MKRYCVYSLNPMTLAASPYDSALPFRNFEFCECKAWNHVGYNITQSSGSSSSLLLLALLHKYSPHNLASFLPKFNMEWQMFSKSYIGEIWTIDTNTENDSTDVEDCNLVSYYLSCHLCGWLVLTMVPVQFVNTIQWLI